MIKQKEEFNDYLNMNIKIDYERIQLLFIIKFLNMNFSFV